MKRAAANGLHAFPEAIRCYERRFPPPSGTVRRAFSPRPCGGSPSCSITAMSRRGRASCASAATRSPATSITTFSRPKPSTRCGLAVRAGTSEDARSNFRQALERGGHSRELKARVELNLGVLSNIRGELVDAVSHYERSVESYRATNDEHGCATAYWISASPTPTCAVRLGRQLLQQEFRDRRACGGRAPPGDVSGKPCRGALLRERYEEARRMAEAALAIFDQLDSRPTSPKPTK